MTPEQCRMARAALNWTSTKLAREAGVGISTVARFEKERGALIPSTLAAIRKAFEDAGIEFIDSVNGKGPGVRLVNNKKGAS